MRLVLLAAALCLWPTVAWAQPGGQEEDKPKRYVNQYAFVVLVVAMGVIVVTKPSGREEQVKERYLED